MIDRRRVFDALRHRLGRITQEQVAIVDALLDAMDRIMPDATDALVQSIEHNIEDEAISRAADLIRRWEGFRPTPYLDPAGIKTIGYGFTDPQIVALGYLTRDDADRLLRERVARDIATIRSLVTVPLNANQLAALASFVYNVGIEAFKGSTLLRRLNEGKYDQAADEFLRWIWARGRVLPGLRSRRQEERQLFLA
jgi:lysozyme